MEQVKKANTAGEGREPRYTTIRVRIYPTAEQAAAIEAAFESCRYLWNEMLSDEREFYAATDQHYIPPPAKYKRSAPFLGETDSQALVGVHQALQKQFRDFFADPKYENYPAFRRKKSQQLSYRTFCHHRPGRVDSIRIEGNGIVLPKLRFVKAKIHRRPLHWWQLQHATVTKTPAGKYFCSLTYRYEEKKRERTPPDPEKTAGLQYSLRHFYVTDTGGTADPPEWTKQNAGRISKMQEKLGRMVRGSKNYEEQRLKLARAYEHIANQRLDYMHKESRRIANACDAVCICSDNVQEQRRGKSPGELPESGFGMLRVFLDYKLDRLGKQLVRVGPDVRTDQAEGRDALEQEILAAARIKAEGLRELSAK